MTIIGYCMKCHRVRYVHVKQFDSHGNAIGVCTQCEREEKR